MNCFRAYKLKLPKQDDGDKQANLATEAYIRPPLHVTPGYDPLKQRASLYPSPDLRVHTDSFCPGKPGRSLTFGHLKVKTEIEDCRYNGFPPISSCLPQIGSRNEMLQLMQKSDLAVPSPASSKLQSRLQPPQLMFVPPIYCSDALPSNPTFRPSTYTADFWKDLQNAPEASSPASAMLQSPKHDASKTSPFVGYSSPPSSDGESSPKSSSSPSSTDSGYPPSIEQSTTMSESVTETPLDSEKRAGCFKCSYCTRAFSYVCHLKVHERVHTGEKPYSCKFCSQQFSQLGSLTVHMRIHTGAKPYQCGQCSKKFRHVNSLRRHQRQVHNMTNGEIAASIDKCKEEAMGGGSDIESVSHMIPGPTPSKRRMEHFVPRQILDSNAYRQEILNCYQSNLSPINGSQTYWKFPTPRDVYTPFHHKSKFISELECKNSFEREKDTKEAAKVLCALATAITSPSATKPAPKTWRPFSTDEEKEQRHVHQDLYANGSIRHASLDTGKSSRSQSLVSNASISHQEVGDKRHPYKCPKEEFSHAYWSNILLTDQIPKPACLWPSALSLQNSFLASSAFQFNVGKSVTETSKGADPGARPTNSPVSSVNETKKRERDGNSSDEGFSSSCSTRDGDVRSPDSSLSGFQVPEDSMNRSADESHHISSAAGFTEKLTPNRMKEIANELGNQIRKWSKDSGNCGT